MTSFHQLNKLKDIIIVDGYIHEADIKIFETHSSFYKNIPSVINNLCIDYYHIPKDRFDPELHGEKVKVSDTMINKSKYGQCSVFLSNILSSGKHQWRFKIWQTHGCTLSIGVWDNAFSAEKQLNTYLTTVREATYTINFNDAEFQGPKKFAVRDSGRYGEKCEWNCIIDMYLDLDKLDLSFAINTRNYGTAFKLKSGTSYRGCSYIFAEGAKLELLLYQPWIESNNKSN